MLKDFDAAEKLLSRAEEVNKKKNGMEPRDRLFLNHDRARLYKDSGRYEEAMKRYEKILFEKSDDGLNNADRLNSFMEHRADIFSEILTGIAKCLLGEGRIIESENLYSEKSKLKEIRVTGIYGEIDKHDKLEMQKNKIRILLNQIFLNETSVVEYKDIRAEYNPETDNTIFKFSKKVIKKRSRRFFLVFKCLVENTEKCVSEKMLNQFVLDHGESINKDDSGLRMYVGRLKKEILLDRFIELCPKHKGGGWQLK